MKRKIMTRVLAASLGFVLSFSAAFGGMENVRAQAPARAGQNAAEQEANEAAGNEFALMRQRFFDMAVGGEYDPDEPGVKRMVDSINETGQLYWDKMNQDPACNAVNGNYLNENEVMDPALDASRDYIFAEYPLGHRSKDAYMNANSIHFTFQYIRAMALAYQTKGCKLYHNQEMLADMKDAIAYVWENHYNGDSTVKYGNWFSWELGAPIYFGETLILLYDEFEEAEVKKYAASTRKFLKQSGYTGANATWCMRAHLYGAILSEDESYFAVIQKTMPELLKYSTSGDGYYTDGTFVQHDFYPYNGGYGLMCLTDTALLFHMLAGTQWDLGQGNAELVYDWVRDSYEPIVYNGLCMDMFRGREITRTDTTQPRGGLVIANAMLMLAESAPEEVGAQFKGVVKQWFSNGYMMDQIYNSADTPWYKFPLDTMVKVSNILADESIQPISFDGTTFQMNAGARTVHWSKGGWAFGISMASKRIKTYEVGDSNRYGHYTGNGATYLYNSDLERHDGVQKPTMDWYRLPGATAVYKNRQAVQYNQRSFTGGVTDGAYGVTGMDMAFSNKLSAKKSWFMFDDEVVALGSDINGPDQVETTLENYMLKENNRAYHIDGAQKEMAMDGQEVAYSGVHTLHMQGNTAQSDIGFYFPGSADLTVKSEARTGKWTDLGEYNTDPSEQQADYFTVWEKHSQNGKAENASYAYVLLPDYSKDQTEAYAKDSDVEILQQDHKAHAVYEKTLGILGANFWQDGYHSLDLGGVKNYLTCDSAATVMVAEDDQGLSISVTDTTQENPGYINLEINRAAKGIVKLDDGVEVLQTSPSIKLRVNANRALGKNFHADFSYDAVGLTPVSITDVSMDGDDLQVTIEKSANADSYLVQVGTESGNYAKTVKTKRNVVTIYGLTPGETYYLAAQAVNGDAVSELGEEVSYTIPGITVFHDEFENFDKMLSYTSAWSLDAGNPANFNGDITRIKRTSNTAQSFTYMLPGLQDFHLEAYGYDKDLGVIRLYTSADGVSWTEQPYSLLGIAPTTSWYKEVISAPEEGVNKGANYLKVEVEKHKSKDWAPQFTKFDASMRSNSDRKTVRDTLLNEGRLYEARNIEFVANGSEGAFGGDTDVARASQADNEMLYSWTNIQDAQVTAYRKDGGKLKASASEDGDVFVEAKVEEEAQGTDSAGYTKTLYSIPCEKDGRNYLKLTLEGDIVLSDITFDYKPDNVPVQKIRFADRALDGVIGYNAVPLLKTAPMNGVSELSYSTDRMDVAKYNNGTLQFEGQGEAKAIVTVDGAAISAELPLTVYKDMCLNKPVTASSANAAYPSSNAVDTNTTVTRWQSANDNQKEWFQVDLGEGASFDAVDIQWYSNGEDYDLLASEDGAKWKTLKEVRGQAKGEYVRYDFEETVQARYLKMQGISEAQYSFFSIRALQRAGSGSAPSIEPWNLAIGKEASCSSYDTGGAAAYPEGNAIDGDTSTRWASARSDDQWFTVDLGEPSRVERVNILWETAAGKEYKVQISDDGETWTDMLHETNNTGAGWKNYTLPQAYDGRYVRMLGIKRTSKYGYSMYEFEIIGTNESAASIQDIEEISIEPQKLSLLPGQSAALSVNTKPEVTNSISVGWSSSNPELVAVTSEGTVTAKGPVGTAVVTAYSVSDQAVKAECQVTVEPYYGEPIKVESVRLKAPEGIFWCGNAYGLAVDVLPENATNKTLAFTSSNPKVASVSISGRLTALTPGKTTITVRSVASGLADTMEIEIRDADREAADATIQKIEAIGQVSLKSEAAIKSARQSYDALTAEQKELVGAGPLEVLEQAEQALALLQKEEADRNAADAVAQKINAIGEVALESEAAIRDARQSYEALTVIQKELVGAELLKALEQAEQALALLQKEEADRNAADAVAQKINAIGEVALESEAAIQEARIAYEALTAEQKALVGADVLAVLEQAEQTLIVRKQEAADQAAAKAVEGKITGIGEVTLESGLAIMEARNAYEALTETQKGLVSAELLQMLTAAEERLAELKAQADKEALDKAAADAVVQKISGIGEVALDSEALLKEARAAYEALTADQKALVGQGALARLEEAEGAWQALKQEADRKEADQAAADQVNALIMAIGSVTLDSKAQIAEARSAYEALTDGQKALVGALSVLQAAEGRLAALEAEAKPVQIAKPIIRVQSCIAKKSAGRVKISFAKPQKGQKIVVFRKVGGKVTLIGETTAGSLYDSSPASGKKAYYYAKAVAVDQAKYQDSVSSAEVSISLPANTQKASAKQDGAKCVKVAWKKAKGASAYYIYRSNEKDKGFVKVARVSASKLVYLDKKAKVNKKYYYKVVTGAKGKYSSGKVSNAVEVASLPSNTKKVAAKQDGKKRVKVTWKKVKGASAYVIYRSSKKDKGFVKIGRVAASKQAYVDTKVKSNKTYYYKVVTKKNAGRSSGKVSNAVKAL